MARLEVKMPEDFLLKVSKLAAQTDVIIPKVLEVGGKVVLRRVKENLRSVIGRGTKYPSRATGELLSSLGLSPAKQNRAGNWNVKVGFAEPRPDGGSNAKVANIIEYGKHGQPAKPFLKPAIAQSRNAGLEAMKAKIDSEAERI